jgi:RNA polymerase sigma-70 factor (ECF subfamily)
MDAEIARDSGAHEALATALQHEPGRILSVLARTTGDIDLAEDALQDAAVEALVQWPGCDVPSNPAGWLVTTARRRAIDRLRRIGVEQRKYGEITALARLEREADRTPEPAGAIGDERLALMFACCHPALPTEQRVALTLRSVGGLTTAEIARAFLVSEATMKQRLSRAKRAIRDAQVLLRAPSPDELQDRQPAVHAVLYLIFNEGYVSTRGVALARNALTREAIRLTRLVVRDLPSAETYGLLALMLYHEARIAGRDGRDGALLPIEEQDRSTWDRKAIVEANDLLAQAARMATPGQYQLQAAIASVHANAARASDTNWPDIARLYDGLLALTPTDVIRLNRAVAYGMARGPDVGLEHIDAIAGLDGYHLFHASRADMLRRLGRTDEASAAYAAALALAENQAERRFLERRLAECPTPGR